MTVPERAAQIWPLLTLCASHRQTLTYALLGKLIGYPHAGLSAVLEPIHAYCAQQKLPPLAVLVVRGDSGLPGDRFVAPAEVPAMQARVFALDWLAHPPPSAQELAAALTQRPARGTTANAPNGDIIGS